MNTKEVWRLLVCAAAAAARQLDGDTTIAVDAAVAAELLQYPQLSASELRLVQDSAFTLARFASLMEGAFKGYCDALKRNGSHRAETFAMTYLLIFQYKTLGGTTVATLVQGAMPQPRLGEYVDYLLSKTAVAQYSVPLWRKRYDEQFLTRDVLAALTAVANNPTCNIASLINGESHQQQDQRPLMTLDGDVIAVKSPVHSVASSMELSELVQAPPRSRRHTRTTTAGAPHLHSSTRQRRPRPLSAELEPSFTVPEPRPPRIKRAPLPPIVSPPPAKTPRPQPPPSVKVAITAPLGQQQQQPRSAGMSSGADAVGENVATASPPAPAAPPPSSAPLMAAPTTNSSNCRSGAAHGTPSKPRRAPPLLRLSPVLPPATTTAVLRREAAIRDRQRAQAEHALTEMEIVGRNAAEQELWRQAQEDAEARAEEIAVVQRHLAAVEAEARHREHRQRVVESRQRNFAQGRARYQAEVAAYKAELAKEWEEQATIVQQQRQRQDAVREVAMTKVAAARSAAGAEVRRAADEWRSAAQEAEEQRQTQQAVLIQEIHRMRERLRERQATAGAEKRRAWASGDLDAALGRMSVDELRAALAEVEAEAAAEKEGKSARVSEERSRVQWQRHQLESMCAAARAKQQRHRQVQSEGKARGKAAQAAERAALDADRMEELHAKLMEKREAALAHKRTTRELQHRRRHELLLRAQDGATMEQGRWGQYEAGMARRIKWEQRNALQEAEK